MFFDQLADSSGVLAHHLQQLYPPPAGVKLAAADTRELPAHLYAFPPERVLPIATREQTWWSAARFGALRNGFDKTAAAMVEGNLRRAATYWRLLGEVEDLWAKQAAAGALPQTPDDDFAIVRPDPLDGTPIREYPLRNPAEVKAAADWLVRYRHELTWEDRRRLGSRILEKAAAMGVPLTNPVVRQCAGDGRCATADIADAWEQRASLVRDKQASEEARRVATAVRGRPAVAVDPQRLEKLGAALDEWDRTYGLTALYTDGGLAPPEEVLYGVGRRDIAAFVGDRVKLANGSVYTRASLEDDNITPGLVRDWLGNDVADAVEIGGAFVDTGKLAAAIEGLSPADAATCDTMLKAAGVAREFVDRPAPRLDDETLRALLAQQPV